MADIITRQKATLLTNGQDLNNILTAGLYAATANAIAQSIENAPFTVSFGMIVIGGGGRTGCVQVAFSSNEIMSRKGSSSGWSKWYRYSGTVVN